MHMMKSLRALFTSVELNEMFRVHLVKKISIVSGCFNEAGNVEELVARVAKLMANLWKYEYELFQVASSSLL